MTQSLSMQIRCHFLAQQIQETCIKHHWTLSLAESCTGGYIASCLTMHPQASKYFLGSIVSYSNMLKKKLLLVKDQTLVDYGPVSAEVIQEMVEGLAHLTESDYSLAVSGLAGPGGGTENQPVGTIWGAIKQKGEEAKIWSFHVEGNRKEIIQKATQTLLTKLLEVIQAQGNI